MIQCDECGTVYEADKFRCPYCGVLNPDCDLIGEYPDEDEEENGEAV